MSIKFSVCITYFYNRNNLNDLLKELKIEENKDIEVLIRNDNPEIDLKINNYPRVKIFQNKQKPIGEIESIRFLLANSNGDYVSIIADDDLIDSNMFEFIRNDNFKHKTYLSPSTTNKREFRDKKDLLELSSKKKILMFLSRKLYLSGTVGAVYQKDFLLNIFKKLKLKTYLLDVLLLLKILDESCLICDHYYGFNNTETSRVSSKKIDTDVFVKDYIEVVNNIENKVILEKFVIFILLEYYSIVHREEKFKIRKFYNFLILNLKIKKIDNKSKIKLFFLGNFYLLKLILKAI
mgnify:CR=1 FL=1